MMGWIAYACHPGVEDCTSNGSRCFLFPISTLTAKKKKYVEGINLHVLVHICLEKEI